MKNIYVIFKKLKMEQRNKIISLINKEISFYCKNSLQLVTNFENYIYTWDRQNYNSHMRNLLNTLKDLQNNTFFQSFIQGFIKPEDFIKQDIKFYASDQMKALRAIDYENNLNSIMHDNAKAKKIKSIYTCGKCSSNAVLMFQQQTRSADEPMTQFFTCCDCNNRWQE